MGRQSLPGAETPDPGRITGPQDFGRELSLARQQAGLTIREVARASGIPASTVGDYFAGRHLPPARQPELLTRVLAACGITDRGQVDRWQEALTRIRRMPGRPPARGPAPYRGLASFQPEDAAWFFGREELALHLVRLATGPSAPGVPLAVVGPSGSGKSSLLRAGLIPRLRSATAARPGGRAVALITPGVSPVDALARGLAPLAGPGSGGPLRAGPLARGLRENPERYARLAGRGDEPPAIIVDQLEEIFTAGAGETGRQEFVAALAALAGHTLVVTGLRADFYSHALNYPALARSLQERHPAEEETEVRSVIQQIALEHRRRYGYRRITAELRRRGMQVNHKRVVRINRGVLQSAAVALCAGLPIPGRIRTQGRKSDRKSRRNDRGFCEQRER